MYFKAMLFIYRYFPRYRFDSGAAFRKNKNEGKLARMIK